VPKVNATQRRERDAVILRQFLAGESYRTIGRDSRVNLSAQGVADVVNKELAEGAERRGLLREHAATIHAQRLEMLLSSVWESALAGDCRAIELARRIIEQQVKFYRLKERLNTVRPASVDEEPADELARYRARFQPPED
jgi:hypothetical protein